MKEPRKDAPEIPESIPTTVTLEEFLENDVPGYEYINSKCEHGIRRFSNLTYKFLMRWNGSET